MVGNLTIQGQIVGTATFDGAKISAVVTIAPPINATVIFGRSGVSVHNLLSDRDAEDVHPKESITGLGITDSPEFANTQITTLKSVADGGILPNAEATWIGATAKSVLSYLQKLVSKVYAINSRVEVLEDNYILKYVVAENCVSITIDKDKHGNPFNFVEGDEIIIDVIATYSSGAGLGNRTWVRINGKLYYDQGTNFNLVGLVAANKCISEYSTYNIKIIGDKAIGTVSSEYNPTSSSCANVFFKFRTKFSITSITSFEFFVGVVENSLIDAGSIIIIKKV